MFRTLSCLLAAVLLSSAPAFPQTGAMGEAEAQKCEEKIASVRRDVLGRYDTSLQELQVGFQKASDLEGALAVRAERQRLMTDSTLSEENFVAEPKALRALQAQMVAKIQELTAQLVQETVPKLIELKKALTVAGKLDEAVTVRSAIERLQNKNLPIQRQETGSVVPADALLQAYSADRSRADKTFRGQKLVVRGIVGGFRQDQNDPKTFLIFLAGAGSSGWVQCGFSTADFRFREETQFNTTVLVISTKADPNPIARLQKGAPAEIRGKCDGYDEVIRLSQCEIPR